MALYVDIQSLLRKVAICSANTRWRCLIEHIASKQNLKHLVFEKVKGLEADTLNQIKAKIKEVNH